MSEATDVVDRQIAAFRNRDLERFLGFYAADVVFGEPGELPEQRCAYPAKSPCRYSFANSSITGHEPARRGWWVQPVLAAGVPWRGHNNPG